MRFQQGWHGRRNSSQAGSWRRVLFLLLDRFPVSKHIRRRIGLHIAENMAMPSDEFVGQSFQNVINGEIALLFRHLRIEQNLKQQIAEFPTELRPVTIVDCFQDLVGLFDGVGLDGIESLFAVPRTSARTSKSRHNGDYPLEKLAGGGWHSSIQFN